MIPIRMTPRGALATALSLRDAYTQDHCGRVEAICTALGQRCGLAPAQLPALLDAARLHDIGKIGIPDHILFKPGRLDPDEWKIMQSHAEAGARICAELDRPDAALLAEIVRHHHENFDGSGYPDGLAGDAIPLASRIIRVVDSYDAMTTRRPYQPCRSHAQAMAMAMAILRSERGTASDPLVFDHFAALLEEDSQLRAKP